jgi:transglutaminase-like putative cysteine protease
MEDAPPPRYNYEMDAFLYSRTLMETATYRVYPMTLDRSRLGEYEGEDLEEITAWLSGQISGENRTIVIMGSDLDVVLSQTWGIELGHYDEVRALTWSVIGSAQTQHEQLLAIQAYLRGPEFSYTLAPNWGDHDDPVWGFLQTKRGYCIHFATAMVAMASTIGIPGRVSVGYNLGPVAADGWRYATGGQAHMWPEFHYGETGWVPYEPTPAAGIQAPREVSTENPTAGPSLPVEGLEPTPGTSEKPSTEAPTVLSPVAGVAFGAVGLGLGAVVGGLAWRGSFTDERTWRLIRRRGQRWGWFDEGTSVRSAVERLEGQGLVWMGLREFRDDLEARWYGPDELRPAAMSAREAYALWRQVRRLY